MGIRYHNTVKKMFELAEGRELIMWGNDSLTRYIYDDVLELGGEVKYFVDDMLAGKEYMGVPYKNSIELFLEDKEKIYIIVFVMKGHGEIYQKLIDMGFEFEKDFYIGGVAGYYADFDVADAMLAYNRYYGETLGFKIYGNIGDENGYRIMVLGGSTSDTDVGNNKSWPEQLYERLKVDYSNLILINGAMGGYASNLEFLKLIRDGLYYRPDMILTFDGFNDINFSCVCKNFPTLHPYGKKVLDKIEKKGDFGVDTLGLRSPSRLVYGIEQEDKADYEIYINNLRMIHAVADEFDMIHIGFLQPMILTGKTIIDERSIEFVDALKREYKHILDGMCMFKKNVAPWVERQGYMHDLTSIFDNKSHMYYDICHATDEGNAVIAEHVETYVRERMDGKC